MGNKTIKGMAESITKAGGGEGLIIKALESTFEQGYSGGYKAAMGDVRRAKESKSKVADTAFKAEMDVIDDVMKSKWA